MMWRRRDPDRDRWYLLPAMQHGARRKHFTLLGVAIAVGVLTAAALAAMIYYNNRI